MGTEATAAATVEPFGLDELRLAGRNRGSLPEALRYDVTPGGLHYLLIHFDVPDLDPAAWRLSVGGNVARSSELGLAELRALPATTIPVTLECAGNGRALLEPRPISQPWLEEAFGTAEWTGTPLRGVLERAGLEPGTVELVFTGADRGVQDGVAHDYARSLTVEEALRPEVLLAYAMNGRPLEPQHGAPVRLLVPGWYGMASVKWLTSVEAVTAPFEGFQQAVAYRYMRDEHDLPGAPVSRIRPRALMVPPGVPEFQSRGRLVPRGRVELIGRAWSGAGPVRRVEVAVDGRWADAALHDPVGEHAWRGWSFAWEATPGRHELRCRATDAAGETQPLETPWNVQGMGNNVAQRLEVVVE
jgi:DMSO/TMAO reductase YedYZ molybdopterin-dependent catalytic subunit